MKDSFVSLPPLHCKKKFSKYIILKENYGFKKNVSRFQQLFFTIENAVHPHRVSKINKLS